MDTADACPVASSAKGMLEGGLQRIPQPHGAGLRHQHRSQASLIQLLGEDGDAGFFTYPTTRSHSERKKKERKDPLQHAFKASPPDSYTEGALPATTLEVDMDETEHLTAAESVFKARGGLQVAENITDANTSSCKALGGSSCAGCPSCHAESNRSALATASSRSGHEDGAMWTPSQPVEKNDVIAVDPAGNVQGPRRSTTTAGPRMREKKKPLYELRRLYVPAHRLTPLRKQWVMLIEPLVTHLQLQVRMNVRRRCVELRRHPGRINDNEILGESSSLLQKGSDYVRAFLLGFAVRDALALLRLDDLSVETFEVRDVKRLGGEHLSRCLARLSGRDGKTKFAIENATRTRLVIADTKIHVLGSYENIRLARHACCSLILGAPPGKVYNHLRTVTRRLAERL